MTYFKVRVEGWTEFDPEGVELTTVAREMVQGSAICTLQQTVKTVKTPKKLPTEVREFFNPTE